METILTLFIIPQISKRYKNAHAYVNAGILMKVERTSGGIVVSEKPNLVFGGITPNFVSCAKYLKAL